MEGKEVRFGIAASTLFATVTTGASCGAVNAMHDAFTPLGGMVPLVNMQLGEVIFGGVGTGLYGMLMFAVLAVFFAMSVSWVRLKLAPEATRGMNAFEVANYLHSLQHVH